MKRRGTVLGLLLAAGLLGLLASAQPWFSATGDPGSAAAGTPITFSGAEASGGLTQALAAVVLAGVLLTLVLAVAGRRVLAVLLAVVGAGMVAVAVARVPPSEAAVRTRFRQVSLADSFSLDATSWPWPYAAAGLLVIAGALLLWRASPAWIRRTRRYERPGEELAPARGMAPVSTDLDSDPAGAWRALDAGLDPTAGPGGDAKSAPDVHRSDSADTMAFGKDTSSRRQDGDQ